MVGKSQSQHNADDSRSSRRSEKESVARQILRTIGSAVAVACIGAASHRMGVQYNIPYGLVLSYLMVAGSTFAARRRGGGLHVGLHILCSTVVTGIISQLATQTKALIILGFADNTYPYWTQHVGVWWMLGMVVVQLIVLLLPSKWVVDHDNTRA